MAEYKVPQDVEADDKLIGPFSFKQFVFVMLAVGTGYLAFLAARANVFLALLPMPFFLVFATLALPLRKDQPTDVYIAALINYMLRPKKRLWGQEGMTEHVIVTAPKVEPHQYTDGLTSAQVRNRLASLAKTVDTRGWATKNIESSAFGTGYGLPDVSDRLVAPTPLTGADFYVDENQIDDMLDTENSRIAQNFAALEAKPRTVNPQATTPASNPQPGATVVPGAPQQVTPRTVSEIAAIAEAKNPTEKQQTAPIFTGKKPVPENLDVTLIEPDFEAYPQMNQKVIQPVGTPEEVGIDPHPGPPPEDHHPDEVSLH